MTFAEAASNLRANAAAIQVRRERNCQRIFGMSWEEVEAALSERQSVEAEEAGRSLRRGVIALGKLGADWAAGVQAKIRSLYPS